MATSLSSTKILVTGASGFIGLHTTLRLLQLGYNVRTTVRTETHENSIRETLSKHVNTNQIQVALADLLQDAGWSEAVHGCDFVIHTASPFPLERPKDASEVILPAREGTLRVLRAAQVEGIRRVVVLSSIGAVYEGHFGKNKTFNENDWSETKPGGDPYHISKTLAERAAWDYILSPENKNKMEMVAINPTNVFGPVLDSHFHTSTEWYRTLMRREVPGIARTQLDFVDVRDLVEIMIKTISVTEAAGKRFICNAVSIPLPEFAEILHQNFATRGYRVPTRILPNWFIRLLGVLMPKVKSVADSLDWDYVLSTDQVRSVLGWQPRPYKQTILDMAESLIEYGLV